MTYAPSLLQQIKNHHQVINQREQNARLIIIYRKIITESSLD